MRERTAEENELKAKLLELRAVQSPDDPMAKGADIDAQCMYQALKEQEAQYLRRIDIREWIITGLFCVCVIEAALLVIK